WGPCGAGGGGTDGAAGPIARRGASPAVSQAERRGARRRWPRGRVRPGSRGLRASGDAAVDEGPRRRDERVRTAVEVRGWRQAHGDRLATGNDRRSEEHTSELQSR